MQPSRHEEVTVGVIGAEEIVHRTIAVARKLGNPSLRLVTAVYDSETDAYARAVKIASRVDVCLFAGPLPYHVAVAGGELSVPATYVPTGGSALFATLLRAVVEGTVDPTRISIDTVAREDVEDAYSEVGLDTAKVHIKEYESPESAGAFLDFHRRLHAAGTTTGAVTTVPTVDVALRRAGVPTLKMTPTLATLRSALNTAILMGSGAKLEESRIVVIIVRAPASTFPTQPSPSNYRYQETRLSLHRELLREARALDAAVVPRDEHSFLVVTTMGSLRLATDDLVVAPFLGPVSRELGLQLEIGIGLGRTTREAEVNAHSAVEMAAGDGGRTALLVGPDELILQLSANRSATGAAVTPARDTKSATVLARLVERLDEQNGGERVVDAEQVAELLGVTLRSARRMLRNLEAEGLAWLMPPVRTSKVGRPPRPYQLLTENLAK
jgi:hypothetical protein